MHTGSYEAFFMRLRRCLLGRRRFVFSFRHTCVGLDGHGALNARTASPDMAAASYSRSCVSLGVLW